MSRITACFCYFFIETIFAMYDGYKQHLRLQDFVDLAFHEFDGEESLFFNFHISLTEKIQSGTTRSQSHPMLQQDPFLGSLLVLPVELWNGNAG